MIVRILDDGQYEVPDADTAVIDQLDTELIDAVEAGDDSRYHQLVADIVETVHHRGRQLPADHLGPSHLIIPGTHTTRADIAALLERGELM